MDLTTVSDDHAVVFNRDQRRAYDELTPSTAYVYDGHEFQTLPRRGALLSRVATVNDVHFGEIECGVIEGSDVGPTFRAAPGADPYPVVMNRGAATEIAAIDPQAVIAKGDLTAMGSRVEYQAFLDTYGPTFGTRLHAVRGNHDAYFGETFASEGFPRVVDLDGVRLAVIDTVIPGKTTGQVTAETLEWLGDMAAESDRPVLLFGHHHVWSPDGARPESATPTVRPDDYFGIHPDDSERLIALVERSNRIVGYFAGHTHRNRVRRVRSNPTVPWVEVACVKDYPGAWAEYRIFEGSILQVVHRISTPDALAWSEQTRGMYGGLYHDYAFGDLDDRCFEVWREGS